MVVMILQNVPTSLRGELTRWMLEPRAGVFVSSLSALVRDKLWERVCQNAQGGACIMIHNAATEQGFACRFWAAGTRVVEDFDGLTLVRVLGSEGETSSAEGGKGRHDG